MKIFESYKLNTLNLKNRIVMAPMTRSRAIDNVPNDLMQTYYSERAGAGLIISEGTSPSVNGLGYPRIPGAFSPAQIEGWKAIAQGVHKEGGLIFVQLMHCGRITASENLPEAGETIAPSAVKASGKMMTDAKGLVEHETPREMTLTDIIATQLEYVESATKLVQAGVDGVELHSANGYLMDQFLNPKSNLREDGYGGTFQNRARFVLETVEKVVAAVGSDKVGIRFSPYGEMNDVQSNYDDLVELYVYLATELKKSGVAYIHLVDHRGSMGAPKFKTEIKETIKGAFTGPVITGGDIDSKEKAQQVLDNGFDLAYIGRQFISNPDLLNKLKDDKKLTEPKQELFYTAGKEGYTDY
ncbi:alkene reductase [Lacinutrix chionoecetis]